MRLVVSHLSELLLEIVDSNPRLLLGLGLEHGWVLHLDLVKPLLHTHPGAGPPEGGDQEEVELLRHPELAGRDLVDVGDEEGVEEDVHEEHDPHRAHAQRVVRTVSGEQGRPLHAATLPLGRGQHLTCRIKYKYNQAGHSSAHLDAPDKVDVRDERHEVLLKEGVVCKSVRCSVDGVVWYKEGKNVDQNTQGQGQVGCNKTV